MLRIIREGDGDIEIMEIGPLTNVAAAILMDPETMRKVPRFVIMGGAGSMDLPDAAAFACITRPDLIRVGFEAHTRIETKGAYTRGATIFETAEHHYSDDYKPNSYVVTRMYGVGFKNYLEELIRKKSLN